VWRSTSAIHIPERMKEIVSHGYQFSQKDRLNLFAGYLISQNHKNSLLTTTKIYLYIRNINFDEAHVLFFILSLLHKYTVIFYLAHQFLQILQLKK